MDVATYRTRPPDTLGERLVDATIGFAIGAPLAVLAWLVTMWLLLR